ncbi:MAG: ABC transporter substrate-binding protein [Rhodospirillaceae bacterium]|nr:ABC transporter substrate-binding protein [Rhodospirillaceae bacterium]
MTLVRACVGLVVWALVASAPATADKVVRLGVFYGPPMPFRGITYSPYVLHPLQFDALTDIGADGQPSPGLALSWQAETPTSWVFALRPGVTFSNGEPADADAVVATITWLLSDEGRTTAAHRENRSIVGAAARDPLTVEIRTATPDLMLPGKLFSVKIMPPRHMAAVGMQGMDKQPIGTGPFVEVERSVAKVRFRAHRTSWRAPKLDRFELIATQNQIVRTQALRAGELDIALDVIAEDVEPLRAEGFQVLVHPLGAVSAVQFVTNRGPPLSDARVRQALNYAVDKQSMVDRIFYGLTKAPSQFAPGYAFGAIPDAPPAFPYDPAKAKALLAEAGYPDGFEMTVIVLGTTGNIVYEQMAADLARVGVKATLKAIPPAEYTSRLFVEGFKDDDAFDYGYIVFPVMDSLAPLRLHSCLNRVAWHCNREITDAMVAADAIFDRAARRAATEAIMRRLLDDPPGLLVNETFRVFAATPRITGLEAPFGLLRYDKLDLVEAP